MSTRLPRSAALWISLAAVACGGGDPSGPPAPSATKLVVATGPSGVLASGEGFSPHLSVQLQDASSQPVSAAGVTVTVSADHGSALAGTTSVSTDAAGRATFADLQPSGLSGAHTLTFAAQGLQSASVAFTLHTGAAEHVAASTAESQTAVVGTAITPPPAVVVTDAGGNPVAGVLVVFHVASGGGQSTIDSMGTGPDGKAHVGSWIIGPAVGDNRLTATVAAISGSATFTVTGVPIAPGLIVKSAGDGQSAPAFAALPTRPAVLVTSNAGQPMSGIPVTFTIGSGGGTVTGGSVTTDASGVATVGSWTLGAPGANTLVATSTGVPGSPLTFSATAQSLGGIQIAAGDHQLATPRSAVAIPPSVLVSGTGGTPLGGVSVTFSVGAGGGTVTGAVATSNAQGVATVGSWKLGPAAGSNQLIATAAGFTGSPVTFNATASAVLPTAIVIHGGNNQTTVVGAAVPVAPSVLVTGAGGAPVPNVPVTFTVAATNAGAAVSGSPAMTDAQGVATVGSWTVGHTAGNSDLVASVSGVAATVTFHATGTAGPVATAVPVGSGQSVPVTQTVTAPTFVVPGVTVSDQFGNHLAGVAVTFAPAAGSGTFSGGPQSTDASGVALAPGWTLGTTTGPQTLVATVAGLASPVSITVTAIAGPVTSFTITAGNGQSGTERHPLFVDPAVQLKDQFGNAAIGVPVQFVAAAGNGTVVSTVSGAGGIASTQWVLGTIAGTETMTASVNGGALSATFTATAAPITTAFNIVVRPLSPLTPSQQAAFAAAAQRWSEIIQADIPDLPLTLAADQCFSGSPAINEVIDDVVIYVSVGPIDGTGGTLAESGPCIIRSGSALPALGELQFDAADLAGIEAGGELQDVILHEMGHVLGFGTIWSTLGLVQGAGTSSPMFLGPNALAQYRRLGGTAPGVPLENTGGPGTADSHWLETAFGNELMTGYIAGPGNPLSVVTIASLRDLGYAADLALADPLPGCCFLQRPRGPTRPIVDRRPALKPIIVDAAGRPVGRAQ